MAARYTIDQTTSDEQFVFVERLLKMVLVDGEWVPSAESLDALIKSARLECEITEYYSNREDRP
jgi:hypothetical protein